MSITYRPYFLRGGVGGAPGKKCWGQNLTDQNYTPARVWKDKKSRENIISTLAQSLFARGNKWLHPPFPPHATASRFHIRLDSPPPWPPPGIEIAYTVTHVQ